MILLGKNAIITGTSRGIGKKMVEVFAREGANVWACARIKTENTETFAKLISETYGVIVKPLYFDLTNTDEIKESIREIMADKRNVDIMVNNAGVTLNALFQMTTMEQWKSHYDINLFSIVYLIQYVSKLMARNKKGNIVNISSSAALDGNSGRSAYGSSKASLLCLTKVLATELADIGIRVNSIAPGITQTEMLSSMTNEIIEKTVLKTCLKRAGQPEEIANVAAFLSSDMSSYINGQVIRVDGGLL